MESNPNGNWPLSKSALVAGLGLLLMFLAGIFANGPNLEISDPRSLRICIIADMGMFTSDVLAAVGLYFVLKPVNDGFSLLSTFFRLAQLTTCAMNTVFPLLVVYITSGRVSGFTEDQEKGILDLLVAAHTFGFHLGMIFFGLHFMVLGYLVVKSLYMPKILGVLLCVVAVGYLVNSLSLILYENYEEHKLIFQIGAYVPAMIAELWLCFWLLLLGCRKEGR